MPYLAQPRVNVTLPYATAITEVRMDEATKTHAVFAKTNIGINQLISRLSWSGILPEPNFLTIQIAEGRHIRMLPSYLECINHSCDPNVFFDTANKRVICIKPITKGEELSFFYPSAEWDMAQPFNCHCGTGNCISYIRGAIYLTAAQRSCYRFTDFIQQKLLHSKGA